MDKKNTLLLTVIAIATLLVAVVGATFAFFSAQTGSGVSSQVQVTTHTTDSLTYGSWSPISITASQENFAENAGDQSGTTSGSVTLVANADEAATYCYTAKLEVSANDFEYTTTGNTPELVLSAKKNNVDVITNQDVTTGTTTVNIPTALNGTTLKHTITADADQTTVDNWTVTVTFKNLATDQSNPDATNNVGKTFTGNLKFDTVSCS